MIGTLVSKRSTLSGPASGGRARRTKRWLAWPLLAALLGGPAASAWAGPTPTAHPSEVAQPSQATTARATTTDPAEDASYASREAASKGLENFKGGETTVIITGGALILVLIVLVILL